MEIVVNHVTKTIKNITVIEDVSLTLTSGTIYGLRGVNGSGKTMVNRRTDPPDGRHDHD